MLSYLLTSAVALATSSCKQRQFIIFSHLKQYIKELIKDTWPTAPTYLHHARVHAPDHIGNTGTNDCIPAVLEPVVCLLS